MESSPEQDRGIYIVWRRYQRRAEVVSRRLGLDLIYLPHAFRSRWLRPLDYLRAFVRTVGILAGRRPPFVIFQSPPVFTALAARLLDVPYVVDAHNATFQSSWGRLPGSRWLMCGARVVLVHNQEVLDLARRTLPGAEFLTLADPLEEFGDDALPRDRQKVVPICSFAADEPVEVLLEVIGRAGELTFCITGGNGSLPAGVRAKLDSLPNVELLGFLEQEDYQRLLSSCGAALVLTTRSATQPSGACEALSSDTPLVVSRTDLTEALFGGWAHLVDHEPDDIARALRTAVYDDLDLQQERAAWNDSVDASLDELLGALDGPKQGVVLER